MTELASAFLPLLLIHFVAVVSPGPNLMIVVRNSLAEGRRSGIATAAGIISSAALYISLGALGAIAVLALNETLAYVVRIGCGLYLVYLAANYLRSAWRGKDMALDATAPSSRLKGPFLQGLLTNLFNPKSIAYFVTFFTVIVPSAFTSSDLLVLGILMMPVSFLWYSAVACAITRPSVLVRLRKVMRGVETVTGLVLGGFGLRLLVEKF